MDVVEARTLSLPLGRSLVVNSRSRDGFTAADQAAYAPSPDMLGGLAPGTGRSLNALIKMRAETGVERTGAVESPLFKPGQCSALFPCPKGRASRPRGSP